MSVGRSIALTLVLSALTGALGAWAGSQYVVSRMHQAPSLHEMVHGKLHLTPEQDRKVEDMERDYAAKRQAFEAEMRAANAELARSFQASHAYTPEVQAAVDRFHHAMGALQKESMSHVIAMRSVLTPDQARQFDDTVVKSLNDAGS
ncbi:MAG: periplasmic heavy metal sensor [Caulobacteraceae bacterium]